VSTPPVVTLGGLVLGGDNTYGWDLTYGVKPFQQAFVLTKERAGAIPLGQPLTFAIDGVRKPLRVEHAYALELTSASRPQQRTLVVSDRRWLWSRKWVCSSFNVRRSTGDQSLVSEAGQPIELAQLDPKIRYAKWSLFPPENGALPWTALQVLDFVFSCLGQPFRVEGTLPQVEVQDLILDDDGASALERVLSFLPGADVFMDYDGTAVVINTLEDRGSGAKTQTAADGVFGRKHVAGGDIQVANRSALRPSHVVVMFTPEVEVRFNYSEGSTRTTDSNELVNVAASPDVTLALANGNTVARGSYVDLATLFATWGAFGCFVPPEALSFSVMARFGFGASILEQVYSRDAAHNVHPVSSARISAACDAWRRTYQIDELFMQRLASIRANRVAILNQATGLRARSEAYCPFVRRPNKKNPLIKAVAEDKDFGWIVNGYAALLANATAAPALVSVVDGSAGIIRVEPQQDPWGRTDAMMLGTPGGTGHIPRHGGHAESNRTGVDVYSQWAACVMSETFNLATVLTCVPASPNTTERMHQVTIQASEVGQTGSGPPIYVRVFPGVMTARFAWADEHAEAIRGSILRGDKIPPSQLVNARDVQDVARATAQAAYANLQDQPTTSFGPVEVDMNPDIKPSGPLGRVRHGMERGITVTLVTATGYRRPVDLWPFLSGSARRAILRVLDNPV
jgi:hypothetical protein